MNIIDSSTHYAIDKTSAILKNIHQHHLNITIYDREIDFLNGEINHLLTNDFRMEAGGNIKTILKQITVDIDPNVYPLLLQDIKQLLTVFKTITNTNSFQLLLATINSNMCRKFHSDNNDLRLLCTYSGPGNLWLAEANPDYEALNAIVDNDSSTIDNPNIQQAKTGSVVILKGAKYANKTTNPIVHRSPTIEETGGKRLLLRVDMNGF